VLIHRLGYVALGEASVLVAVSTPHRRDAFEAAAWLMDAIKGEVPIWKQEHWADGRCDWVHPGSNSQESPPHAIGHRDAAVYNPRDVGQ
jgi:molybdopterin synthase catalytic subunit